MTCATRCARCGSSARPSAPSTRRSSGRWTTCGAGRAATGPGARALTAMTALAVALTGGPAAEASALAHEAFAGDGLEVFEITAPVALGQRGAGAGRARRRPGGDRALRRARPPPGRDPRRDRRRPVGRHHPHLGRRPAARRWISLERAHEGERLWGTKLDAVMAYSAAFTALAQLERGDPTTVAPRRCTACTPRTRGRTGRASGWPASPSWRWPRGGPTTRSRSASARADPPGRHASRCGRPGDRCGPGRWPAWRRREARRLALRRSRAVARESGRAVGDRPQSADARGARGARRRRHRRARR